MSDDALDTSRPNDAGSPSAETAKRTARTRTKATARVDGFICRSKAAVAGHASEAVDKGAVIRKPISV